MSNSLCFVVLNLLWWSSWLLS